MTDLPETAERKQPVGHDACRLRGGWMGGSLGWSVDGFVRVVRVGKLAPGLWPSWPDRSLTGRILAHVHLDDKPGR